MYQIFLYRGVLLPMSTALVKLIRTILTVHAQNAFIALPVHEQNPPATYIVLNFTPLNSYCRSSAINIFHSEHMMGHEDLYSYWLSNADIMPHSPQYLILVKTIPLRIEAAI
jgi:hypothetical protein